MSATHGSHGTCTCTCTCPHTPRHCRSAGPRVRLVRAPWETAWTLARAYNLAAQFARGATLLKVDADTRLHPAVLENQTLPSSHFGRGCRDRATTAS